MIFEFLDGDFNERKSGDKKDQKKAVEDVKIPQQNLELLRDEMIVPTTQNLYNASQNANANAAADYGDIMGRYRGMFDSMGGAPIEAQMVDYSRSKELEDALSGYGEFSRTGGYSDEDIRNLRARGVSPIRTAYGNAQNEIARRTNLQGGYSPNAGVLQAKMARESGQAMADAAQNVNASLAEEQRKGRISGLEGLGRLSIQDLELGQRAGIANQQAGLSAANLNQSPYSPNGMKLQALGGMSNLYSATPGQAQTFGNQLLGSTQNWLGLQGQEGELAKTRIAGQQAVSNTQSGLDKGLGTAKNLSNILGNVAPLLGGGSSQPNIPTNNTLPLGSFNNAPPTIPYGSNMSGYNNETYGNTNLPNNANLSSFYNTPTINYGNMGNIEDYNSAYGNYGGQNNLPNYGNFGSLYNAPNINYGGGNNVGRVNDYNWSW